MACDGYDVLLAWDEPRGNFRGDRTSVEYSEGLHASGTRRAKENVARGWVSSLGMAMTDHNKNLDFLDDIVRYKAGELSPSAAHRMAMLLEEDEDFRDEFAREEVLLEALDGMRPVPMPRDLIARSVRSAVGNESAVNWFSLDNILLALGVGVACTAAAHFLSGRFGFGNFFAKHIDGLVELLTQSSISGVITAGVLVSVGVIFAGILLAFRLLREK